MSPPPLLSFTSQPFSTDLFIHLLGDLAERLLTSPVIFEDFHSTCSHVPATPDRHRLTACDPAPGSNRPVWNQGTINLLFFPSLHSSLTPRVDPWIRLNWICTSRAPENNRIVDPTLDPYAPTNFLPFSSLFTDVAPDDSFIPERHRIITNKQRVKS